MSTRTEIDTSAISQPDRYKLLIGLITPRPIAWVSTISPDGRLNLAPFSFFTGVGSNPMLVMFCPANKPDGSEKDSLRNAKPVGEGGQGEFVISIVSHALGAAMSRTANHEGRGRARARAPIAPSPAAPRSPDPAAVAAEVTRLVTALLWGPPRRRWPPPSAP